MKLWAPRHGLCIFCEFHAISRPKYNLPQSRRLHVTPAVARERPAERSRRKRSDEKTPHKDFRFFNGSFVRPLRTPQSGTLRHGKSGPEVFSVEDARGHLLSRIDGAFRELEQRLKHVKSQTDSEISQYDALDPDGTHWPAFEEDTKLLLGRVDAGERHSRNRQALRLEQSLMKATSQHSPDGQIQRILHFAFIDYVLQRRHTTESVAEYADLRHPTEWYIGARTLQREIHLHVGPTNSGKTYNALKRLEESEKGAYAGPLRLLAHEVYSRFNAKGLPCDLVTGDDVRENLEGRAKFTACTVEMFDTNAQLEVAVIDEIQMIAADDRGWAWTRAFLGANAKEVHLCGETRVVPLIRELAASMGDTLHVHHYDRLSPLKVMSRSLRGNLKNLRKGDCVVSFTIMGIHALKKQIEIDTGRRVAIVYGSLPPETRAHQAELFNDPDNDYDFLVASNAIGMGLNLAVKRIVFETLLKFNGTFKERLSVADIKQIAGRAGRYRTAFQEKNQKDLNPADLRTTQYHATTPVGLVTCLDEEDLPIIRNALESEPEPIKQAGLLPGATKVEQYAQRLPHGLPFEYIFRRLCEIATVNPRFKLCDIRDQLGIVRSIEHVKDLTAGERHLIGASPADYRTPEGNKVLRGLAKCIAEGKTVTIADVPEIPLEVLENPMSGDREYLAGLEHLHKALILFLWLSYRYLNTFKDQEMAFHAKQLVEEKINATLLEFSANPKLRKRLLALKGASKGLKGSQMHMDATTTDSALLPHSESDSPDGYDSSSALPIDWSQGVENTTLPPVEKDSSRLDIANG